MRTLELGGGCQRTSMVRRSLAFCVASSPILSTRFPMRWKASSGMPMSITSTSSSSSPVAPHPSMRRRRPSLTKMEARVRSLTSGLGASPASRHSQCIVSVSRTNVSLRRPRSFQPPLTRRKRSTIAAACPSRGDGFCPITRSGTDHSILSGESTARSLLHAPPRSDPPNEYTKRPSCEAVSDMFERCGAGPVNSTGAHSSLSRLSCEPPIGCFPSPGLACVSVSSPPSSSRQSPCCTPSDTCTSVDFSTGWGTDPVGLTALHFHPSVERR
mmetsp:Transcript_31554/g.102819  ORF Transcript_31554/g.102819 Transcript_31554/m.102819 type:complete len:271 (+) Transcript_31554:357-1169(+)